MAEGFNDQIWKEHTWTHHARELLRGLDEFPKTSKITIVLRHSQRYEPKLVKESELKDANMELTPLGEEIAVKFGENLPIERPIRLLHSPRSRCKVTAEKICQGFTGRNGKGDYIGVCNALYGIGINNQSYLDEFNKNENYQVILRYLAGVYSPDLWPLAQPFYQRSGGQIWSEVENIPEGGINIFVTHDFHIMIFRFGWFAIPPDKRWVDYLGGFAFSIMENHILLLDYGKFFKLNNPYWWKNKNK
ncbi:MAG: histidine phosphatase family protein [Candidatus Lokiarchaeota archaeon]|nr:histidine phosphatase family protein [Candidatus Lokiarchaeota archaeon]